MPRASTKVSQLQGSEVDRFAGTLPEGLRHEFEQLGLSSYESAITLALLQLGCATALQLARLSGVPRTSAYQVLEELNTKGLAERLPDPGPALWTAPGRDGVLDRLDEAQEDRLRQHRARTARVRQLLAETLSEGPSVPASFVHMNRGIADAKKMYEALVARAQSSLEMFTSPPYTWAAGNPNSPVLDMLQRGVTARVLYERPGLEETTEAFLEEADLYHQAGVEARVAEELPIKLVVVDRQTTLLAMKDPKRPDSGFPTALLIEHPGFAAVQADAFEQRWATAEPYADFQQRPRSPTRLTQPSDLG